MAKITSRYNIKDGLYIYKQDNSEYWYSRFVLDGIWYAKATKEKDEHQAAHKASELLAEYRIKLDNDIPIARTKRAKTYLFPKIAELAIRRMKQQLELGTGKAIYTGYIQILNKYHNEFFASESIRNIDNNALRQFDEWRVSKMGRVPAKSTILDHNAAFNRVFDEALIQKYESPPLY